MAEESKIDLAQRLRALTPEQRALLVKLAADRAKEKDGSVGALELRPLPRQPDQPQEFPISFSQQRLWLLDQLSPEVALYNIPLLVPIRGNIVEQAVQQALNELLARHETLRTSFVERSGEVLQVVYPPWPLKLERSDLSDWPASQRSVELNRMAAGELARRFDLQQPPLLRARLVRLAPDDHRLVITVHHIVFDGWSAGLFLQEFSAFYYAAASGSPNPLRPLAHQYADYAAWQRKWVRTAPAKAQIDYWSRQLFDLPVLAIPSDRPRPAVPSFQGESVRFRLRQDLTRAVREFSQREGATVFMTLLAGFAGLLARYTRQDDVPIGTYSVGRNRADLEPIIGCFLNTMVLRIRLLRDTTFSELVRHVRQTSLDAYANQDVPFEMVLPSIAKDRGTSAPFSVTFQYLNLPTLPSSGADADGGAGDMADTRRVAAFDLAVTVSESGGELVLQIEYSTDVFDHATVNGLAVHYEELLNAAVAQPSEMVWTLPVMTEEERRRVVYDWNDTRQPIPESSITDLFEAQADRTPDAVAFIERDRSVTYRELRRRVHRLAALLADSGAAPGARIGLMMRRSLDAVTAVLAIFQLGCVYVPLDPACPADRLNGMVEDADLDLVLASRAFPAASARRSIAIEEIDWNAAVASPPIPAISADSQRTAYILFTSGSTGRPKGVAASERQILNRLHWMWHEYPFAAGEVACHKTALTFIDSLWEIFGGLLAGTPTVIVADDELRDLDRFVQALAMHRVTRIWLVPSLLQVMVDSYPDLASRIPDLCFWVSSGEILSSELYGRFREALPGATLYNLYGTSEVWDATWHIPDACTGRLPHIPIGKPLWNMRVYVLDVQGNPQPPSVWGELYVAGVGVGEGYVASPERNAERFLEDPFVPGERMYRTGDLARWRRDGTIEYLGRADRQVKVRGHRVELEEVERVLAECRGVGTVAVVTAGGGSSGSLTAYVMPSGHAAQRDLAAIVREHARRMLPEYMVPSRILARRELPLTSSGKVDRTLLASSGQELEGQTAAFLAPANDVERAIAKIWAEVLDIPRVSTNQDFFELGGHSLTAMRALSRINQEFAADVSLQVFFNAPTVAQLAAAIGERCSLRIAR